MRRLADIAAHHGDAHEVDALASQRDPDLAVIVVPEIKGVGLQKRIDRIGFVAVERHGGGDERLLHCGLLMRTKNSSGKGPAFFTLTRPEGLKRISAAIS